jgi:hypothetical protein
LTLPKIREALEREIVPQYKVFKRLLETSRTLGALPFGDPVWDYSYDYYQLQAQQALEALGRGDVKTAQRILKEMRELAEGVRKGKRYLIIIGDTAHVEET